MEPRSRGRERGRAMLIVAACNRPAELLDVHLVRRPHDGGTTLLCRRRTRRRRGRDGLSLRFLGRHWSSRKVEVEEVGAQSSPRGFGSRGARKQMNTVTAICSLRESFISSGELLRCNVGGPHVCTRYRQGERGTLRAAIVLHVSWAGRTLWAHDASPASTRHKRAHHGPGGYCRLSGN